MDLEKIKDIHSVSRKEGKLLYTLARTCPPNSIIVEIGSWKGYSTIWLAQGAKEKNATIYAIDHHRGSSIHRGLYGDVNTYPIFLENIKKSGLNRLVIPIVRTSQEAEMEWGDKKIDLLFIDGNHEDIENDFIRWERYLKIGGIIALHDTVAWPSMLPYKLVISEIYKSGKFEYIRRVCSITYATKTNNISSSMLRKNKFALYKRYLYQFTIPFYNQFLIVGGKVLKGKRRCRR